MTIRIAMWSGPRNLSTAMMRSFGSRADTFVSDEPFYGAYLKATGDPQPMADEVMASMDCDWHCVARTMTGQCPAGAAIWYQKHMAHHMVGPIAHDDLPGLRHAFLIRDPERVIASYAAKRSRFGPTISAASARSSFSSARRIGSVTLLLSSIAPTFCVIRPGCCRVCARRSTFPGIRRC